MKAPKFQAGDIVQHYETTDCRIIYFVGDDAYYFVDYNRDTEQMFLNPTKSAFGFPTMEQKYRKVGEVTNIPAFQENCGRMNLAVSMLIEQNNNTLMEETGLSFSA